jgi:hypothetical protein
MLEQYPSQKGNTCKRRYAKGTTALSWKRLSAGVRARGMFRAAVIVHGTYGGAS